MNGESSKKTLGFHQGQLTQEFSIRLRVLSGFCSGLQ
jgi:hypothetical protein